MTFPTAWTDANVDKLKKLWERGYTASQIAAEIGGISRNAVIGKVHRLNLPMRSGPDNESHRITSKLYAKRERKRKATRAQKMGHGLAGHISPLAGKRLDPAPLPPPDVKPASAIKFESLEAHHCRFVFDDGAERTFCGEKAIPGQSWCAPHRARVFQQIDPSRLRRRPMPEREKNFYELAKENA